MKNSHVPIWGEDQPRFCVTRQRLIEWRDCTAGGYRMLGIDAQVLELVFALVTAVAQIGILIVLFFRF